MPGNIEMIDYICEGCRSISSERGIRLMQYALAERYYRRHDQRGA